MKFTNPFLCAVFMFMIFIQRSYAQPPNDTCVTAQTLAVEVGSCTSILYTNVAATTIGNPATPSCWSPNTMSNTVWFSFVATTADVEISTNFAGTLGNTQIAVYSGACGSLVQIGCQEDVNTTGGLLHTDVILHGLTVNNTYYIAVDGNGNTAGTFGVCVQQSLPIGPPLPIQDCAGAQTLCSPSALSVPDGVGGVGATQEAPTCFGAPGERSSNWYTFTAATSGNLAFTITPTVAVDYDFAIFDTTTACLGTELSCNWSPTLGANGTTGLGCPGGQCEPVLAVTAGQTYTILVDRFTAASNAGFTLDFTGTTATFASPNPTFTATTACIGSPTQFTNTTNGNFTYSWNFGDGFTSNLENPSHIFATSGPQSVTLLVTAVPGGCQNSITQTVTVNPLPTVNAGVGGSVCPGACINLSGSTNAVGSVGPLSFSNNTLFPIPDGNIVGVNSPIIVSGIAPTTLANTSIASVCINLTHTWDSDLDIFLQCPNGTIIQLSTDNGGLGENYTNTCFTPTAISPITTGTAPFTGTYAPEDSFALLNGCNSNGTWNLFVQDDIGGDLGSINSWTITFNNNLPPFTWTPTTAMTNATTLTPTVCPLVPTTYTLTANNGVGCTTTSQVTIGTTAGPTATISYPAAAVCTTSGTQAVTIAGTGAYTGGTYSSTVGLTVNSSTGLITPASSTPGPYTITYTIPASGGCPAINTTTTITINAPPNAGVDGGVAVCDSSVASIDLFSLITGEQAGGVWTRTTGAGGIFNAGAGTFVPAVGASSSTFTYTVAGVAPCANDTSLATITINPQANAGADGSVAACDSSVASIDLFSLITGEQTGGVWTRTSGAGGTFNAGAGTFLPAVGASSSTFTYTVAGVAPCANDTSLATITINPQANAGVDGSVTVCDSSVAFIDLFSLITGEQAGGVWTRTSGAGGTFNAGAGTFVPAVGASSSTFTYTVAGVSPCANDTSLATITINPQANAGADGSVAVCDSSVASIDLFSLITGEQTGGVWTRTSGAGGTFNAGAGTFVPAVGASSSTFTYTVSGVAPCANDTSLATITINPQANAGVDGSVTICDSSIASIDLFSLITGEQAGGVWTRTSGAGGTFNAGAGTFVPALGASSSTFTYTVAGVAPCTPDTSVATITISAQPNAGVDGSVAACESSITSIDLFSLITGEQSGGVWTRTSGTGGTFNAGTGTFVPAVGASSSTFTYTVSGVAPCASDSAVASVTINPVLTPTINCGASTTTSVVFNWAGVIGATGYSVSYQINANPIVVVGPIGNLLTYSVSGLTPGDNVNITVIPTGGAATCFASSSTTCTANNCNPPTASISYAGNPFCSSDASVQPVTLVGTGLFSGGVYSSTLGLSLNTANGEIIASTSTPGPYTITYTIAATAGCSPVVATTAIVINAPPVAGVDGSTAVCESSITSIDLFSLITGEQTGGVWTRTTGAGGTFNAGAGTFVPAVGASPSTFTYTVAGVAPCANDTSLATITINPQPNAGVDGSVTVCDSSISSIDLFSLITDEQAGGVWTRTSGAGGTFNAATGTFVPTVGTSSSTFIYTLTGVAPCINDTSLATININPQPTAGADGSISVCETNTASINLFSLITGEQTGGVWTRTSGTGGTFNATSGTFIPTIGATTSTFIYTLNGVAPCVSDSSMATVTITAQPIAGTLSGIQTVCQGNTRNFSPTIPGGTWTSSNPLVATVTTLTGIVVGISPGIATITYTILGTGGCPNATVDRQITVTPTPQLTNSGINIICSNETSNVLLTATASGTNFTWTVSQSGVTGATSGSGNSINQTLSSTNGGTAIYTVTPSLNGCVGNAAYVAVNVRPLPKPTLSNGAICIELATGTAAQPFVFNTGLGDSSHDFQWFFEETTILDETGTTLAASEAGTYSVIATNSTTGCVSTEVSATITSSVIADSFTTTVTDAFEDYPYIIVNTPPGTGPFQYQLDSGAFQNSNVFYNVPSGLHTINVKDNEGCTDLNGVVYILNYPHFFTPNGDTYNDTWNIWDLKDQDVVSIFIFDRYGKFIKEISPRGTGWDGTMNGYELPATDYWFTVDYFDPNTKTSNTFKSHFSLKR